ncbi:GyrI-like domain-containing protein [Chengkuizengella sediminis]|nr:GyrI-like domain-containing protein [Chengkuizengella sediminis]
MIEEMKSYVLKGGKYAVIIHNGPASTFLRTLQYILETWLPSSEYELDNREHFERLSQDYSPTDPNATEEVWVPIK